MTFATTLTRIISLVTCVLVFFLVPIAQAKDKPNIVIILADDVGNADLGYRGSKIRTPNIDSRAKNRVTSITDNGYQSTMAYAVFSGILFLFSTGG
jgi:hypothetical protein